jgi:UDP-3-O-[3-hydroxymyristoyl] glucosamine N-acyltransferase
VSIGAHCVIEAGASIGRGTVLMPRCYLGEAASVGEDSYLYPGVVIREECHVGDRCIIHPNAVIGADGFGFAFDAGRYHKIPQVGNVVVGNDVEIGANTAIDRATTDSTRIGDGTKIDNLAQIGHNVNVGQALHHRGAGRHLGQHRARGLRHDRRPGRARGPHPHRHRARRSARRVACRNPSRRGETVFGTTAIPIARFKRLNGYIQRLPQIWEALKKLESRMERAEQEAGNPQEKERVP